MFMGLADNTAVDLGGFTCTGVGGEDPAMCRVVTDFSGCTYDRRNHRLVMFGGGHSSTMTDAIHALDLTSSSVLRWSSLYTPTPCSSFTAGNLNASLGAWTSGISGPYPRPVSAHTYDLVAVAPTQNEVVLLGRAYTGGYCNPVSNYIGGPAAHFGAAGAWSFSTNAASRNLGDELSAGEWDPIGDQFVVMGAAGIATYSPATRVASPWHAALKTPQGASFDVTQLGYANHLVYFPPTDRFYYFMRGSPVRVVELALNRANPAMSTVQQLTTTGPTSPHEEPGYDYDVVNHVIGGGVSGGRFYVFDPPTRTWSQRTIQGGSVGKQAYHALSYDPVNNVFLFVTDYNSGLKTWGYRLAN